jgi:hypothetical protein
MNYPASVTRDSTTECLYRAKEGTAATLIDYDTHSSASAFAKSASDLEHRGLKLGPVSDLGDQAYYFSEQSGEATVSTIAVLQGSLLLVVTGSGTTDEIGSIARYALNVFEAANSPSAKPAG